jgi:hypothetical protein
LLSFSETVNSPFKVLTWAWIILERVPGWSRSGGRKNYNEWRIRQAKHFLDGPQSVRGISANTIQDKTKMFWYNRASL